jgi:3-deoxy-D-manno-octulosonic-acid transferase
MHFLYSTFFILLTPFILLRLYLKGFQAPAYHQRWQERFAIYNKQHSKQSIWFHAVSVGEAEAVFPLIKLIQKKYPHLSILVTTTTPTGSQRVQATLGGTVSHVYLPYDIPYVIHRFFNHFKPKMAVIMEKEIWPNLFSECHQQKMPLFIINARLSNNSAKNYKKIPRLIIPTLNKVTKIFAQTEEDMHHFVDIGINKHNISVLGNLKFDTSISKQLLREGRQLHKTLFQQRFVWIAASTHKGEEAILLKCYQALKKEIPELLLIIVPRHPDRFIEVNALAKNKKFNTIMRSNNEACTKKTDVYIADTLGELKMLYASADVSFVCGSLTPVGGHNILESLAAGTPTLFGPHMLNFKEISQNVLIHKASIQCHTENDLINAINHLYLNKADSDLLIKNGHEFLRLNFGATEKTYTLLNTYF